MASMDMVQYRSPLRRVGGVVVGAVPGLLPGVDGAADLIMFVSSFKDLLEAFKLPAVGDWAGVTLFFDFSPTFKHYHNLFANLNFTTYLFNSIAGFARLGADLGGARLDVRLRAVAERFPRQEATCSSGSSRPGWRRWWR